MARQIDLIVDWMRVGFIHGVMNTDNMSIAGETIDYGPCAFMNAYNPETVFSSIDTHGRYAFGKQSTIAHWNLTAFANTLLPLISENQEEAVEAAWEVLAAFPKKFSERYYAMMFGKLGILKPEGSDKELVDELLALMEKHRADYTQTFSALLHDKDSDDTVFKNEELKAWRQKLKKVHDRENLKASSIEMMSKMNPKVIPRNHRVEEVLNAAVEGDIAPFNQLLGILSRPYDNHPGDLQFEKVPVDFDAHYRTYCGT
jgi:uncharacterized protein YdiU (UPF0061 family)